MPRPTRLLGSILSADVYGRAAELLIESGNKQEVLVLAEDMRRVGEEAESTGEYWSAVSLYKKAGDILRDAGKKKESQSLYKKAKETEGKAKRQ
ncbi:MAG: hypothetical protein ACP5QG_06155 [candidate division WOR-3 bacterium]